MLNGNRKGFTLLELMIALTITAVIVVIIFGAFRIGIRAWEKVEKDVDIRQRQRIVLDLIKHQLASTSVSAVWDRDQQLIPFRGDNKSIEFVSYLPILPGNQFGMVYVRYDVSRDKKDDKEYLRFYEKSIVSTDKKIGAGNPDDSDFSELLPGMKSITFEYLKDRPGEEASIWQQSWDPTVEAGIPRAVRVTIEEKDDTPPVYMIANAGE